MNVLVTLGGGLTFLIVLLVLGHFAPGLLKKLGGAPDAGADSAGGGSYGQGGGRTYVDQEFGGFDSCGGDGD